MLTLGIDPGFAILGYAVVQGTKEKPICLDFGVVKTDLHSLADRLVQIAQDLEEWDLLRVSLLDITPGQPYSGIKIIRSFMPNLTLDDVKQALAEGSIKPEDLASLLNPPAETENSANVDLIGQMRSFLEDQDNQKWLFELLKPSIQGFVEELVQSKMETQQTNQELEVELQTPTTKFQEEQRASYNLQRTFHWFLDNTEDEPKNIESLIRASALNNYRKQMNIYIDLDQDN